MEEEVEEVEDLAGEAEHLWWAAGLAALVPG